MTTVSHGFPLGPSRRHDASADTAGLRSSRLTDDSDDGQAAHGRPGTPTRCPRRLGVQTYSRASRPNQDSHMIQDIRFEDKAVRTFKAHTCTFSNKKALPARGLVVLYHVVSCDVMVWHVRNVTFLTGDV